MFQCLKVRTNVFWISLQGLWKSNKKSVYLYQIQILRYPFIKRSSSHNNKDTIRNTKLKPFQEAGFSKLSNNTKDCCLSELAHIKKNWIQTFNIPCSYTLLCLLSLPNVFHFASSPTLQSQAYLLLLQYVTHNILKLISWPDESTKSQIKGCGCAGFGPWSS